MKSPFRPKAKRYKMKMATLRVSVKNRNEFSDFDYSDKLNKEELDFLYRFHREYNNADFKHPGEKIHNETKSCNDWNNARNRDLYSKKLVCEQLYSLDEDTEEKLNKMVLDNYLKGLE